jgi:hypothetical protein
MILRRRKSKAGLAACLLVVSIAGAAQAQIVPGNVGNLDDGATVDPDEVLALRQVDPSWVPTPAEILTADCAATADPPSLIRQNGIVLIRGWGHWDCNQALPGNFLEVCLDAVFPSVSCNDKYVPRPTSSLSLPVDFPCVPGVYLTMASGDNLFDANKANDVDHSSHALVVLPQDCL